VGEVEWSTGSGVKWSEFKWTEVKSTENWGFTKCLTFPFVVFDVARCIIYVLAVVVSFIVVFCIVFVLCLCVICVTCLLFCCITAKGLKPNCRLMYIYIYIIPSFLVLDNEWRWMVSFKPLPIYSSGNGLWCSLSSTGLVTESVCTLWRRNVWTPPMNRTPAFQRVASLYTDWAILALHS
jgi:hypothetical protein